jgi:ribonuclease H2 subunit A
MVYGLFYLPLSLHKSLLADQYHFNDSKQLTATFRASLLQTLCTTDNPLQASCGWAVRMMSARDISAGMLRSSMYNLNAQAMDATVGLIREVLAKGVNVTEIYIDTVGSPSVYQKKLEIIFPTAKITVAKKADSLYPCVSAASVCAKVSRDVALDACWDAYAAAQSGEISEENTWGSGYPSDGRCSGWLKRTKDPIFGWGNECRFSWGTAKDILEVGSKLGGVNVLWPADVDGPGSVADLFRGANANAEPENKMKIWFGESVADGVF